MELLPSLLSTLKKTDSRTLNQEYSTVRSQTLFKKDPSLTCEAGALKENIKKNRYKDILPYDQSRVVLSLSTSDSDSDYINASFIQGAASHSSKYIASQGPLSSTVNDFWKMIWQHDVKVIIMACREIEMGKKKCECYWASVQQSASFGPFTVSNQGEIRPNEDLIIRTLTVTYQQVTRSVVQYQFLSWPDHDVPYEAKGILELLERTRDTHTHTSPMLIHCSAGCGRTGVICALDYIHDLLVTKRLTSDFSIMKIVLELRRQRPSAVQTKEQYQFIFTAVICMFERFLLQADAQPIYSNRTEQLQKPEKKTTRKPAPSKNRLSLQTMSDTYAVVNKSKHAPSLSNAQTGPAYSDVTASSGSRTLPASHQYDNEQFGAAAAPVYSTVKPRAKPLGLSHSATPIYDTATTPANQQPSNSGEYHLMPAAEHLSRPEDDDYEDFSSSVSESTNLCSPGGIGFNCRIQKPRGPRDPPAEWSRVER